MQFTVIVSPCRHDHHYHVSGFKAARDQITLTLGSKASGDLMLKTLAYLSLTYISCNKVKV
jgi:hypothetical protein